MLISDIDPHFSILMICNLYFYCYISESKIYTLYMTALAIGYYSQIIHTLSSENHVSPKIIERS